MNREATVHPGGLVGHVRALDGVRAAGVFAVVMFHARGDTFHGGYIGVDIFFVLSGYLITSLLLREQSRTGRISLGRFYLRRALRLLPALVLCSVVVGVAWWAWRALPDRHGTLVGSVAALTYTSAPLAAGGTDLGWMLHTWSLSVEEYFYVVWPAVLLLLVRSRRLLWPVLVVLAVAVAYRNAVAWSGWSVARVSYGADARAEQLLMGCALAVIPTGRLRVPTWAGLAAAAALAAFVVLPGPIPGELYFHGGSTVVAFASAVLIAHVTGSPGGPLGRVLALRPIVWVGQRSYGIYLWNPPLIAFVAATPTPDWAQVPVKLLLTFAVPAISYAVVERPFLRLKSRVGTPPAGRAAGGRATAHAGEPIGGTSAQG
jgi:peptidoglycan/LPS O-acetylase OafA/YrhL